MDYQLVGRRNKICKQKREVKKWNIYKWSKV